MEQAKTTAQWAVSMTRAGYDKIPEGYGKIVAGAAIGAAALPLAGVAAGALVPAAMSTFGTVVPGVGTLHAAGGVAATLQWASATLYTASAVGVGGAAGAGSGAVAAVVQQQSKP
ncbi:hypothetical protein Poli38472_009744 [Pythium oligandrum]|uniref:Uncharacterized protein n=1 Tax=Pythium oligandrum TaxID=41045 RepID=A0A8K1FH21_PYTOL|nr:hypothetical protein Poli38472_009744 [Pythium oligandrum]|eukprot:TMW62251.1 hypothetical protein Poli38472_009744 [Pythium oligandrum]